MGGIGGIGGGIGGGRGIGRGVGSVGALDGLLWLSKKTDNERRAPIEARIPMAYKRPLADLCQGSAPEATGLAPKATALLVAFLIVLLAAGALAVVNGSVEATGKLNSACFSFLCVCKGKNGSCGSRATLGRLLPKSKSK